MISPNDARKAKATISDDLLANALAMTAMPMTRCEVAPDYEEFYAPCGSGKHEFHIVTLSGGYVVCGCDARGTCKHILATVGRPALHAIFQLRAANDVEDVQAVVDFYAPSIRKLPESLRSLVRREVARRDEEIRRSGVMASKRAA